MKSRRSFIGKAVFLTGTALMGRPIDLTPEKTHLIKPLPSLKGRKVLFIHGGWQGHEPIKFRDYMVPWMQKEGASVSVFDNLEPYADTKLMADIDLVIQVHTMSQISNEQEKGLLDAIKSGVGMAGWHGGMCDAFRNNTEYQFMTGGQWVAHPGGIIDYSVQITDSTDPVVAGLSDFDMKSEQYYMHIDPNVKVLATTTFNGENSPWINGCVMPVAWKKTYAKGRVFYTSLGHNLAHVLDSPNAMTIIKRGIQWASASKHEPPEPWLKPVYKG